MEEVGLLLVVDHVMGVSWLIQGVTHTRSVGQWVTTHISANFSLQYLEMLKLTSILVLKQEDYQKIVQLQPLLG